MKDCPTTCQSDATLIANGYAPLVCEGKRPRASGWSTRQNTLEEIVAERTEYPGATNTGLRTGALVGLDIDLVKPDDAAAIEALAAEILGGTSLKRVGAKGMMLCYHNSTPIRKITIESKTGKVEILGNGQQFIAYGIHPDTGQQYKWVKYDDIDVFDPLNVPLTGLPAVTPDQLRTFARAAQSLMESLGYSDAKVTGDISNDDKREKPLSPKKGNPVQATHLREILGHLDPDIERAEWVKIGGAIRNTPVADDDYENERRAIFHDWSEGILDRLERYKDNTPSTYTGPEDVDAVFNTMPPRSDGV